MKTLYICIIFAAISILSAGCASSGLDGGDDCGDHGENVDGTCVCDPGFSDNNGTCVADGSTDGDRENDKIDDDKTDGDKSDTPIDGDTDTIDISTDGDLEDLDKDIDDNCNCPVFEGTFCIDPEISNPDNYKRVIIQPGAKPGCTMSVNIRNALSAVFFGEVACDPNGRAKIESLGCELDYDVSNNLVKLLCNTQQYNFKAEFCVVIDGDEELEDGEIPDGDTPDGDTPDGDAPDGDIPDGDIPDGEIPDGEIPDGDIPDGDTPDGPDEEEWPGCLTNEECGDYRYCDVNVWPWACTDGVCNQVTQCPHGFICVVESGLCDPVIQGDEDTDQDSDYEEPPCTPENQATICGYGRYCNDQNHCASDCSQAHPACPDDGECNVEIGRCEVSGADTCELDSDCIAKLGQWHYCNLGGFCQSDCDTQTECIGYGVICESGRCVVDTSDGDEEDLVCLDDSYCEMGFYCLEDDFADWKCLSDCTTTQQCIDAHESDWICTERGRCIQDDDECITDQNCADLGKLRHFCASGLCMSNCTEDDECLNNTSVCPPDCMCSDFGRCEYIGTDGDEGVYCESNPECFAFQEICNLETHECYKECEVAEDCTEFANGMCDTSIGECYYVNDEGDYEEYERAEVILCSEDTDCPLPIGKWYCQTGTGYCIDKCSLCEAGWECDPVSYLCNDPCAGGDADCMPPGDPDMPEVTQPCEATFKCPDFYYCSDDGWCETECLPSCPDGQECDMTTRRCGGSGDEDLIDFPDSENACRSNDDCMHLEKHYCDVINTWLCISDCIDDVDCPAGYICPPRGQCEVSLAECVSDASCPVGTYCDDTRWKCNADCFENANCSDELVCDNQGRCSAADSEQNDDFAVCTGDDAECPSFSYCDTTICRTDCLPPSLGCGDGLVCSVNGRCEEPAQDVEIDADVDPDPDFDDEGVSDLECLSDLECIYGSHCTSDGVTQGTCQTSCLSDFHCGPGLYCDCHGNCSSNPDPGTNCDGFAPCVIDADCEGAGHCWNNMCRADCLELPELGFNFGCPTGQFCDELLYCQAYDGDVDLDQDPQDQVDEEIPAAIPCTTENQCPYHTYCDTNQGQCMAVCMNDSHCPGTFCNNRGQCDSSASDWDEGTGYLPCSVIDDCPVHAYCFDATYCRIDCVPFLNLDCEGGQSCYRGQCVAK